MPHLQCVRSICHACNASVVPAAGCTGTPAYGPPDNAQWDCGQTASGDSCNATCGPDYKAVVNTSWIILCDHGNYKQPGPATGDSQLTCKPTCEYHVLLLMLPASYSGSVSAAAGAVGSRAYYLLSA